MGEKAFHIVDPVLRDAHLGAAPRRLGSTPPAAERSGQLELAVWEEAYLRGGHFDQDAMLALIEEVLDGGHAAGLPAHAARRPHGVGARGPTRGGRPGRVRDAAELHPAALQGPGHLNVRRRQVWRRRRDGHPAHPPDGDRRRRAAGEPLLRAARRSSCASCGGGGRERGPERVRPTRHRRGRGLDRTSASFGGSCATSRPSWRSRRCGRGATRPSWSTACSTRW